MNLNKRIKKAIAKKLVQLENKIDQKRETLNLIKHTLFIIKKSEDLENREIVLFEIMDANNLLAARTLLAVHDIDELSALLVSIIACYAEMNETSFEITMRRLQDKWANEPIKRTEVRNGMEEYDEE